jgi:phosphoserine phosphatase RsbU/P
MPSYRLQIQRGGRLVGVAQLGEAAVVVGRATACDLVLDSEGISRRHAELFRLDDGWAVRDLGSRNGVLVNGVKVIREYPLQTGDRVQIDVFELRLERDGALVVPQPPAAPAVVHADHGPVRTMHQLPAPRLAAQHLSTLLAFSGELLGAETLPERRRRLCALMIGKEFHATAAMLLRLRRDGSSPEPLGEPALAAGAGVPHISHSVLHALVASETAVLAASWPAPPGGADVVKMSIAAGTRVAVVACPVTITPEFIDLLYVMLPGTYGTAEWLALTAMAASLSHQAEDVWAARQAADARLVLDEELRRAHDLQRRLIPRDFTAGSVDISFGFAPCKGIGGDYVDAVRMDDGRILVVAMDVAGKGMDAALIASGLHTTVHICAVHGFMLSEMIATLNHYLMATWDAFTSVTVAASILEPRTGVLESINCSHPNPIVVSPDGQTRELWAYETIPLGLTDFEIETRADQLQPDEMLVYYSDGLTELFDENDQMLGPDGVTRYLSEIRVEAGPGARASELVARLHQRLADFRGKASPSDDVSFIIVQVGDRLGGAADLARQWLER